VQPLKNFPAFYGTRRFISVFTRALHWSSPSVTPIQSIRPLLSKIHFNIIHPHTSWSPYWSLSFWLFHQYIFIPLRPHSCCMLCPFHHYSLDYSNYTWRRVQVMKLFITQFSPHVPSLHPSSVQIFFSAIYFQTP
jgi:hypothetical protein